MKGLNMKRAAPVTTAVMCMVCVCSNVKPPQGAAIGVNGEWIMSGEVAYVAELLRQEMSRFSPASALEGVSAEIRKNAARQLIADRLMIQEANKRGIKIAAKQFDSLYTLMIGHMGGQAAITRMLTQAGQTEEEFKERLRKSMMVDSLVNRIAAGMDTVDMAACKDYYDKNAERFRERSKIRASQILFSAPAGMPPEKKALVRRKAEKVAAELKAGKDFGRLAKMYSDDPSAKSGGDIGWFEQGDMKPEIDRIIAALDSGQVSEIVETDVGLHIFKKTGEKLSEPKRFFEVAQNIKVTLEMKRKNDAVMGVIDSLMKKADIVYVDPSLTPDNVVQE